MFRVTYHAQNRSQTIPPLPLLRCVCVHVDAELYYPICLLSKALAIEPTWPLEAEDPGVQPRTICKQDIFIISHIN